VVAAVVALARQVQTEHQALFNMLVATEGTECKDRHLLRLMVVLALVVHHPQDIFLVVVAVVGVLVGRQIPEE
jgi:hypothetical protein